MTTAPVRRSEDDTQPIPVVPATGRHAAPRARRSALGWAWVVGREGLLIAGVVGLAIAALWALPIRAAYVADDAMEPTLAAGDRVIVTTAGTPEVGAILAVRSPDAWGVQGDVAFVRLIAGEGQRVTCCDASGRIVVDDVPLVEPYVTGTTDQVEFDVTVPQGRVFVLADRRDTARDSRAILAAEGGALAVDDVLGRVVLIAWPPRGVPG